MGAVEDLVYVGERLAAHARAAIDEPDKSAISRSAYAGQRATQAKAAFEAARLAAAPRVDPGELQEVLDALGDELDKAGLLTESASLDLGDFLRLVLARVQTAERDRQLERTAAAVEVGMRTLRALERDFRGSADRSEQARRVADRCATALQQIRAQFQGEPEGADRAAA